MRGQYVQITKIRYLCFDLVHSRSSRMAGFGRREIEYMQALCIYNIYRVLLCGYTVRSLKEKIKARVFLPSISYPRAPEGGGLFSNITATKLIILRIL